MVRTTLSDSPRSIFTKKKKEQKQIKRKTKKNKKKKDKNIFYVNLILNIIIT